jgi:DNA invertase Pin-like site-specific DNA recombinase
MMPEMEILPSPCYIPFENGAPCYPPRIVTERPARVDTRRPSGARAVAVRPKRRKKLWDVTAKRIQPLREQGKTLEQIARELGCSRATLSARLKDGGVSTPHAPR